MINKENYEELYNIGNYLSNNLSKIKELYLSSIRDITTTKDFWIDTDDTISNFHYGQIVNKFINHCPEQINKIHIATRGVLHTETSIINKVKSCRFCNIFPNKKMITCPLDISLNKYSTGFENTRCNKSDSCVLQKIVLKRIVNE